MYNWIERILFWFTQLFQQKVSYVNEPFILKKWISKYGILYRLKRNTANSVSHATYRFLPISTPDQYLLTCDRLTNEERSRIRDRSQGYTGIRYGIPSSGHPVPSHRLSLLRIGETPGFYLVKSILLWSYPVDFIGINGLVRDQDYYAKVITAEVAEQFLKQELEDICWEEIINDVAYRKIGSNHSVLIQKESD